MVYQVELTKVAQDAYEQLQARAQHFLDSAGRRHPAVRTFNTVQNALDNILPYDPRKPKRALAGDLSALYILPLGRLTLCYTVEDTRSAVIVQTILKIGRDEAMRDKLTARMESGELKPLLETLGIQPYLARMEVNSRLLH
jgi:hypothetical protein